jgi:hypothetical protein
VSVVEEESESLIIVNNVVETRFRACVLNSYELPFEVVFEGVIVALESLVVLVLLLVDLELPALVVPVLLQVVLDSLVALVALVALELPAIVVPVLLLVALESTVVPVLLLESLVKLEVFEWIIASACDSVETIDVALAILAVKELMEEEMVLEVVYYYLFAFEPKKLIFF